MNRYDAFSRCHPAVNFAFFVGAIGFGVVFQHPAYAAAGCLFSGAYYLLLFGRRGIKMILGLIPFYILISAINPLLNLSGETVLFHVFERPYTLEALYYGMAISAVFVVMMLWFGCYNVVLTSDKFVCLFGSLIPSLSLLLVMVLRMIPGFMRKARQIIAARRCIGRGVAEQSTKGEMVLDGMSILSALSDWVLEGSIVTADSMRSRGYGSGKRTGFQIYRMTAADWVLLAVMAVLAVWVLLPGIPGSAFTPTLDIEPISWGFWAYCLFLSVPLVLHGKEAIQWHILRSKI